MVATKQELNFDSTISLIDKLHDLALHLILDDSSKTALAAEVDAEKSKLMEAG